ncbi:MAG: membrane dipeptidase [Acidobacteria bacterium]|nr:membrane dipeptidase [Acidobacteriota bacterium]
MMKTLWICALAGAAFAQRDPFIFDAHVHMVDREFYHGGDINARYPDGQVDLPRAREGGVKAMFFSLYSREEYYPKRFEAKQTLRLMETALEQIGKNQAVIETALRASDIERINRAGKIAAVLDLEGGFDLDGDLLVLRALHRLGLRSAMLPAHNFTNGFADSCCAPARWNGINEQGRKVIREMNRLGMMINVAHASNDAILQTVAASADPVLYTHGGSRHFVDIPRCISDEAAKAIASRGGAVGLHFGNSFHNKRYYEWRQKGKPFGDISGMLKRVGALNTIEEVDREVAKAAPMQPMGVPEELRMEVGQLIEVIGHWVGLLGEDHVVLGSDFDGGPEMPRGMRDIRDYPQVTRALQAKGYSEPRIRKILGLNLLRVFRQVSEKNQ